MKNSNKSAKKIDFGICILLCIFMILIILLLNFKTPLMGEDYVLSVYGIYKPKLSSEFINILHNLISGVHSCMQWNVRIGEQISVFFSLFDKSAFNICNSICFFIYLILIFVYAFKRIARNSKDIMLCFYIFCIIFLFQPCIGESFFWRTGSTNYMWGLTILLLFSVPLVLLYFGDKDILENRGVLVKTIYIFMGVLAGLSNENTVICILIIYFLLFCKKKCPMYVYFSFITIFLSYMFLLFSPSTVHRKQVYLQIYGVNNYCDNLIRLYKCFINCHVGYLLCILVLSIYIFCQKKLIEPSILLNFRRNFMMLLISGVSCVPLIAVPYTEERSFLIIDFFMCVFLITEIDIVFTHILKNQYCIKALLRILCIVPAILQSLKMALVYDNYYNFVELRNMNIMSAKEKKEEYVWEEYPDASWLKSRILTSREDYLIDNIKNLESYFGCTIKIKK